MAHLVQSLPIEQRSNGLQHDDHGNRAVLVQYIQAAYHPAAVALVERQGACSTTFVMSSDPSSLHSGEYSSLQHKDVLLPNNQCKSSDTMQASMKIGRLKSVLQIRPLQFKLSADIALAAREVHGELAPELLDHRSIFVGGIEHQVLHMTMLSGTRFSELQPKSRSMDESSVSRLRKLMCDMASFFAQSWQRSGFHNHNCNGVVGRSIISRLSKLSEELPTIPSRRLAGRCLDDVQVGSLAHVPVVLTHGDLLSTNIMVDEQTWKLSGVLDWAEGEYLPFGMAFYGIERMLGHLSMDEKARPRFVYYDCADEMREVFWKQLVVLLPPLTDRVLSSISLAKDVGVLLWHGFAWDDGRIDRVVTDLARDAVDLAYLQALTGLKFKENDLVSML